MAIETTAWDSAEHFATSEKQLLLLNDAIESDDAGYIAHALGVIARARGMSVVAGDTGISRAGLYKGLTREGDPHLSTVLTLLKHFGMELAVKERQAA